tara:strand:+ start:74 stop:442 length:369 start_codon:yes stop_codon:yes gene_type:complete
VTYTADKVVLAAGIFGTFSLLVDSGIGPAKALQARGVRAPLLVNEAVGSGIGDEVYVAVIFVAAEPQGAASGWSGLAGATSRDGRTAVGLWAYGSTTLLRLVSRVPRLVWLVCAAASKLAHS